MKTYDGIPFTNICEINNYAEKSMKAWFILKNNYNVSVNYYLEQF